MEKQPETQQSKSPSQSAFDLDRENFREDVRLREREIATREREQATRQEELELKRREFARSRWSSPLVLAVIGATLAGFFNAFVAWWNSSQQRQLEDSRAVAARELERQKDERSAALEANKAEGARILEMIKTNDPDKAANNLKFLLDAGLITSGPGERITTYLANRQPGEGAVLPVQGGSAPVDSIVADLESENTAARRAARRILAQLGAVAIPAITDLLAKNRNHATANYRQVLGAVEALAEMNITDRCAAYKKDPQLRRDVEKHADISETSLAAASAKAVICPS